MEERLLLLRASEDILSQYEDYRREFLERGDSLDGTGPMRRIESASEWLAHVRSYENPDTLPEGLVIATQYVLVRESDGKLLGMLQLRHYLNDYLAQYAGHIGGLCQADARDGAGGGTRAWLRARDDQLRR